MIGHLPRLAPGDRISADAYNRLVAEIERLSNLTASPPLYMRQEGSGYHLRMDPPVATGGSGSLEVKSSDGSPDYTSVTILNFENIGFTLSNPSADEVEIVNRASATKAPLDIFTTPTIANNVVTTLTLGTPATDLDTYWSVGNPTRLTVPRSGAYLVVFRLELSLQNNQATNFLIEQAVKVNGVNAWLRDHFWDRVVLPNANDVFFMETADILQLGSLDYIEVATFQNSGQTLNVLSGFASIASLGQS